MTSSPVPRTNSKDENTEMQHMTTKVPKDGYAMQTTSTKTVTVPKDGYALETTSNTENYPTTSTSTDSSNSIIDKYRSRYYDINTWSRTVAIPTDCASLQLPVNVVYVRESETPNCNNQTTCKKLLSEQGISTSQTVDFSFLLTGDGAILEGMAWNCSVEKFGNKSILVMLSLIHI